MLDLSKRANIGITLDPRLDTVASADDMVVCPVWVEGPSDKLPQKPVPFEVSRFADGSGYGISTISFLSWQNVTADLDMWMVDIEGCWIGGYFKEGPWKIQRVRGGTFPKPKF